MGRMQSQEPQHVLRHDNSTSPVMAAARDALTRAGTPVARSHSDTSPPRVPTQAAGPALPAARDPRVGA